MFLCLSCLFIFYAAFFLCLCDFRAVCSPLSLPKPFLMTGDEIRIWMRQDSADERSRKEVDENTKDGTR